MSKFVTIAGISVLSLIGCLSTLAAEEEALPSDAEVKVVSIDDLSPHQKLQYNSLILVEDDYQAEQDEAKKRVLAGEILSQSRSLSEQVPDLLDVWEMRGSAALFLDDWEKGWEAGRNLVRLGALQSTDRKITLLTARLNRRGWLSDDPRQIELMELRRLPELKDDSELSESVRTELTDTINKLTSGQSWEGYNQLKALRLKIGGEKILQFPLARRAMAVGLPVAASRGDTQLAKAAIAAGADVNMSMDGRTALFWAAYNGEESITRILLTAGANPKVSDKFGRSVVVEPAWKGSAGIVKMLLEAGAEPNVQGKESRLLHEVIERGNHAVVAELVKGGANLSTLKNDKEPMPVLYYPIRTGDLKMVNILLEGGADPRIHYLGKDMFYHAKKLDQDDIYDALKLAKKKKLYSR